jgi:1-acyl-sn-glycerol-3-phosphate acyltransferase
MKAIQEREKFKFIYIFYTLRAFLALLIILIIIILILPYLVIIIFFDKKKKIYLPTLRFFIRLFFILNWIIVDKKIDLNGLKAPKKGEKRIYVINHQSLIDGLLLYLLPGNIKFITKYFFGKILLPDISYTGNVSIKKIIEIDSLDIYNSACKILDDNYSLVIFPEEYKNKNGKIGQFRNSAFVLAKEKKCNIIPVVFDTWNVLRPGSFIIRDTNFSIKILDKINFKTINNANYKKISDITKYKILKELLNIRKKNQII